MYGYVDAPSCNRGFGGLCGLLFYPCGVAVGGPSFSRTTPDRRRIFSPDPRGMASAEPRCESCQSEKERAASEKVAAAAATQACSSEYEAVERCMRANNGQINLCKDQWDAFRKCHG